MKTAEERLGEIISNIEVTTKLPRDKRAEAFRSAAIMVWEVGLDEPRYLEYLDVVGDFVVGAEEAFTEEAEVAFSNIASRMLLALLEFEKERERVGGEIRKWYPGINTDWLRVEFEDKLDESKTDVEFESACKRAAESWDTTAVLLIKAGDKEGEATATVLSSGFRGIIAEFSNVDAERKQEVIGWAHAALDKAKAARPPNSKSD